MIETEPSSPSAVRVHRVEVLPAPGEPDPLGEAATRDLCSAGWAGAKASCRRVYLLEGALDEGQLQRIATQLLADPVSERAIVGAAPASDAVVEIHYKPGVMDPVAESTREAVRDLLDVDVEVRTGFRYDVAWERALPKDLPEGVGLDGALRAFAEKRLANPVIQELYDAPHTPTRFPTGRAYELHVQRAAIRGLDDDGLTRMSREAHLFLSLEEMRAIRDYYEAAGREPTDIELETLAQTWSEHCVHKTLKSTVTYRDTAAAAKPHARDDEQANAPTDASGRRERDASGRRERDEDPETVRPDPLLIFRNKPGHTVHADGRVTIDNLLKSTIAAATFKLREDPELGDWLVSVFDDNAGVVKLDERDGLCIKVETHNHPSAIEPYGGAATGIGGCIRDILGTGLAARPIANTDVFAVAWRPDAPTPDAQDQNQEQDQDQDRDQEQGRNPAPAEQARAENDADTRSEPEPARDAQAPLPRGVIHPRRILEQVVAGVRDYGNRMGIPTVNGAVLFHEGYLANPLVFAGCVGVIPLDKAFGEPQPGDRIIALGGATGRDGIHGATFSSAELTDTHAEEFSHAVQIGNAITQKKMLDVILQARDEQAGCLFHAITDCGAGGFSSAIGEMGEKLGASVSLQRAPLKYAGLSYTEIWISEAQERMVLAVPPENVERLKALCDREGVGFCDLGRFGFRGGQEAGAQAGCGQEAEASEARGELAFEREGQPLLSLNYEGVEVGRLSMRFLHEGLPMPTREARWGGAARPRSSAGSDVSGVSGESESAGLAATGTGRVDPLRLRGQAAPDMTRALRALLSHPNIASKHWIVRQYDHEVRGGSAVKPLVGPGQDGPSDASVVRPRLDAARGAAIGCGAAPWLADPKLAVDPDPYQMAPAAFDEAVRNVDCVGADPRRLAVLDNFCWPSCDGPDAMGALVRAAEACHDAALAYRAPFVSGKDSLNNQFTTDQGERIAVPPTLLITALGLVRSVERCVTMDAKRAGGRLLLIGATDERMGGSHFVQRFGTGAVDARIPTTDLSLGPRTAHAVAELIEHENVRAAHDCSDGGLLVAAVEMAIAGGLGLELDLSAVPGDRTLNDRSLAFAETPGRYLLEIDEGRLEEAIARLSEAGAPFAEVGRFREPPHVSVRRDREGRLLSLPLETLRGWWRRPLDW